MDCCSFITSVDTSLALLIGASFAILCACFVNLSQLKHICGTKKTISSPEKADVAKGIICQSVNCVRCNSDIKFQQNAKNRFISHFKIGTNKQLWRLENSILPNDKMSPSAENRYILFLPGLSTTVWFDSKLTYKRDIEKIENNFSAILEEFYKINSQDGWIINEKEGCWRVFHLISQGKVIKENASRCPKTMNTLKDLDYVMSDTIFGYVTFSVMEPGTVIKPHYGSTNCRVRCHLGLKVDPDACYIEAAGQRNSWEVGKCLMFDDSFLHSAHHNGNKDTGFRAILMMDMWHPGLSKTEIDCISTVFTADLIPQLAGFH